MRMFELLPNADRGAPRSPRERRKEQPKSDEYRCSFRRLKQRSKTKNFLSISFSASQRRDGGRRSEKNARKFFGFCTRESASVSKAHSFASPRNRSVRGSFKPPRAPRVRLVVKILRIVSEIHSNFVQKTPLIFTFCEIVKNCLGASRLGMVFFRYFEGRNEIQKQSAVGNAEVRRAKLGQNEVLQTNLFFFRLWRKAKR